MSRRVVILDQFCGPTPYELQQNPKPFAELVAEVEYELERYAHRFANKPSIREVEENFTPPMCTTVYAADENGNAFGWKCRWDSSG